MSRELDDKPVLHCWEDGPPCEHDEDCSSTCMLPAGHDGPHDWTCDNLISVRFKDDQQGT